MNVSLTPELEQYVREQVESGRYRSASEFVRESIRLKQRQDRERDARLAALRGDIDRGVEELDGGEGIAGDRAFERVLRELDGRDRP